MEKQGGVEKVNLKGKVALVTGSSRGIGKATALALAELGADVIINYVKNKKKAEETVKEIKSKGMNAIAVEADVSKTKDCKLMFKKIMEVFGRIDILVNNAGILPKHYKITEINEEEWDEIINVNLKGVFNCAKEAEKYMIKQGGGKIINVSSIAGKNGGTVGVAYAASKAGVIGLTMALARELAPYNITVNAVAPGPVDTEMISKEMKEKLEKLCPLGRIAKPEEVAETIIFLLSNDYITGETININGGRYMD